MNTTQRNRTSKFLALACGAALLVGSFAYFTDRVEMSTKVTAGTVGIVEDATANWTSQLQAGPQDLDNLNPGDSRSLAFTVDNTGNKAIDVRHTIKLSVTDVNGVAKKLSEGTDLGGETMMQFDIFRASDVVKTSNENGNAGYLLKDGATPLFSSDSVEGTTQMGASRVVEADKGVITYYFADTILDGVGANAETGYAAMEHVATSLVDGTDVKLVDDNTVKYDYVLIFRDTALNDFQGNTLHAEMVIEAKQHLNTKSSWQNVETVEFDMTVSGDTTQDSTIDTAPNNQTGSLENVEGDASATNGTIAH